MQNRKPTTKSEDKKDFINGGTANTVTLDTLAKNDVLTPIPRPNKPKPFSFSLFPETTLAIDHVIADFKLAGYGAVSRSDVVRAAVMNLKDVPREKLLKNIIISKNKE